MYISACACVFCLSSGRKLANFIMAIKVDFLCYFFTSKAHISLTLEVDVIHLCKVRGYIDHSENTCRSSSSDHFEVPLFKLCPRSVNN